MTGGHVYNEKERILISLPTKCGGLVIAIFRETVKIEIYSRNFKNKPRKEYQKVKTKIKKPKDKNHKNVMEKVLAETIDKGKRLIDL